MPEFYIADVRKRANADSNMQPQAIPERRVFPPEMGVDESSPEMKRYQHLVDEFARHAVEIPDDPVACEFAGLKGITMEWALGDSHAQIDFHGLDPAGDEPQRFLSLYIFSGKNPAEDRSVMSPLEQYADFSQCLQFPLVLTVTDDPLSAAWQHEALQAIRTSINPIVAAFLKIYFAPVAQ
jgi:hypothetical protein